MNKNEKIFQKDFHCKVCRPSIIKYIGVLVLACLCVGFFGFGNLVGECSPTKLLIGCSVRSFTNPYHYMVAQGSKYFASTLPEGEAEVQVLLSEGSDEKQISDIRALIARGGKNTILYVDPNQIPNCSIIVDLCEEAGIYFVTVWSKPDDLHPSDFKYWVCHMTPDSEAQGYEIAKAIFEKLGGKGKILAIHGMLANRAAVNRQIGLHRALKEFPNIELLDEQAADWNPVRALNITESWLIKYPDVDAIWAANDTMALGAAEALKAKGLLGKVLLCGVDIIPEAQTAIKEGVMTASYDAGAFIKGAYGTAIAYAAYKGMIDPAKLPSEHCEFYTPGILVTKDNIDEYIDTYVKGTPTYDFSNLWTVVARPME